MGQRDSRAPGRRGADHTREHHPRGAGGHREGVTEAAAYLADAQEAADCRPMRIRSLCRSLEGQRPYFTGDLGDLSRSRKPVWAFRSIGGSNPPISVFQRRFLAIAGKWRASADGCALLVDGERRPIRAPLFPLFPPSGTVCDRRLAGGLFDSPVHCFASGSAGPSIKQRISPTASPSGSSPRSLPLDAGAPSCTARTSATRSPG